jgi:tripartite-type tricarboxylate transporter receptor subunit TctC
VNAIGQARHKSEDVMIEIQETSRLVLRIATAAAMILGPAAGLAQEIYKEAYPVRPVTIIMPFAGGSASDVVTRILVERMGKSMGQPFIVDNRPGAGGNLGTAMAAKAAPDGYTLLGAGTGPFTANVTLYRKLPFDPVKDFEIISPFADFNIVIAASAKLPVTTLAELIAYAKANPGLNYGSVGNGSSQHLAGVYFEQTAQVKLTHVPYRNIAQYGPDLLTGQVPLGFQWLPNVQGVLQDGGVRALAVASRTRLAALPDVPTTAEAGLPDYIASGWFALAAPHGTPKPIVDRLNDELSAAIADPAVRARFHDVGAEPVAMPTDDARRFLGSEIAKWRDVIVKAGIPQIE